MPELGLGETHDCAWQDLEGLPNGRSGIRVCADSAAAVAGLNEDNNCAVRNLALGYDMVVRDLVLDPPNPGANETWSATATVRNRFNPETPITQAGLISMTNFSPVVKWKPWPLTAQHNVAGDQAAPSRTSPSSILRRY